MTKPQVGAWVRQRLDARKLSIKAAVERSGLSRQTWYDLMADKHPPSVETQRGVAEALYVEPQWYDRLLAGQEPEELPEQPEPVSRPDDELAALVSELARSVEDILADAIDQRQKLAALESRLAALEGRSGRRSAD